MQFPPVLLTAEIPALSLAFASHPPPSAISPPQNPATPASIAAPQIPYPRVLATSPQTPPHAPVDSAAQTASQTASQTAFQTAPQPAIPSESAPAPPSSRAPRAAITHITVRGARQHNLKNISVSIPRNTLTVVTGLSGSGKSSLAFDTIYAEGQRRYVETLSAYARQFLDQMERPDVDSIDGLSPAISIEQKTTSRSPRSTVGTITEIYDYLRLLWASVGQPHCPNCHRPISRQSADQIVERRSWSATRRSLPANASPCMAPIVRGRKGEFREELESSRPARATASASTASLPRSKKACALKSVKITCH